MKILSLNFSGGLSILRFQCILSGKSQESWETPAQPTSHLHHGTFLPLKHRRFQFQVVIFLLQAWVGSSSLGIVLEEAVCCRESRRAGWKLPFSQLPAREMWLRLPHPLCLLLHLTVELAFWLSSRWLSPRQARLGTRGDREWRDVEVVGCVLYTERGHASAL